MLVPGFIVPKQELSDVKRYFFFHPRDKKKRIISQVKLKGGWAFPVSFERSGERPEHVKTPKVSTADPIQSKATDRQEAGGISKE